MADKIAALYDGVLKTVGGAENIDGLGSCMTRLRFTLKKEDGLKLENLKKTPGVLGYVKADNQHQIIVGPGTAGELAAYMFERHKFNMLGESSSKVGQAKAVKADMKKKYGSSISKACAKIGSIFLPLIPAYIACGLIMGVNNILMKSVLQDYPNVTGLLAVFGGGIFFYLSAIVGYNACKEFGGTPALGVVYAGILNMPALNGLTLFGDKLSAGKGGIIAVLLVCYFGSLFEKWLKKYLKGSTDMFLTPTISVLVIGFISLLAIQPLAGFLSDKLAEYTKIAIEHGGIVTGFVLAGSFLPVVMLGIHQSLIPLYQQLIDAYGNNPLFPILCMAGAGQVGASIAVLIKTKNVSLKTIVKNALPVGILGIGEPLIYGVTLPLFKPFLTACVGAAFGGAVIAAAHVSTTIPFGVSGIVLLLTMTDAHSTIFYLIGMLVAILAGFLATMLVGFDDPKEE